MGDIMQDRMSDKSSRSTSFERVAGRSGSQTGQRFGRSVQVTVFSAVMKPPSVNHRGRDLRGDDQKSWARSFRIDV
jgi:hypothetical protein